MERGSLVSRLLKLFSTRRKDSRPPDNSLTWWKQYVSEFFAPTAVMRLSVASMKVFQSSVPVPLAVLAHSLPRLFQFKHENGVAEELLVLGDVTETLAENGSVVLMSAQCQEHILFDSFTIIQYGKLRVVCDLSMKIQLYDFDVTGFDLHLDHSVIHSDLQRMTQALSARSAILGGLSSSLSPGPGGGAAPCTASAAELLRKAQTVMQLTATALRAYGNRLEGYLSSEWNYIQRVLQHMQMADAVHGMSDLIDMCAGPRQLLPGGTPGGLGDSSLWSASAAAAATAGLMSGWPPTFATAEAMPPNSGPASDDSLQMRVARPLAHLPSSVTLQHEASAAAAQQQQQQQQHMASHLHPSTGAVAAAVQQQQQHQQQLQQQLQLQQNLAAIMHHPAVTNPGAVAAVAAAGQAGGAAAAAAALALDLPPHSGSGSAGAVASRPAGSAGALSASPSMTLPGAPSVPQLSQLSQLQPSPPHSQQHTRLLQAHFSSLDAQMMQLTGGCSGVGDGGGGGFLRQGPLSLKSINATQPLPGQPSQPPQPDHVQAPGGNLQSTFAAFTQDTLPTVFTASIDSCNGTVGGGGRGAMPGLLFPGGVLSGLQPGSGGGGGMDAGPPVAW